MNLYVLWGLYGVWYTLLSAAAAPFALMVLWTFLRLRPANSSTESTWLNGSVLAGFFALIVLTLVSALLYVWSQPTRTFWTYVGWILVHFLTWTFLGSGILFASLQALAEGPRLALRRLSAILALAGVVLLQAASLYATLRYRLR